MYVEVLESGRGIEGKVRREADSTTQGPGTIRGGQLRLRTSAAQHLRELLILQHRGDGELQQIAPAPSELGQGLRIVALQQYRAPAEISLRPAPRELDCGRGLPSRLQEAGGARLPASMAAR
jgi:hypothetical protein